MNRVYKVIWSKAKHCYVVTSEIAKGYGKSAGSKGVKALLSGLVALSIAMGGYGLADAVFVESKGASEGVYTTEVYTTTETDAALDKKADKATTLAGYGITDAYTNAETDTALNGKADKATDLAGYGITDAYTKTETDAALNGKANTATTLAGYGITDAYTKTETDAALDKKADKATTLEGYGITDAYTKTEVDGKISAEENARKAADKDNLKVGDDGVISKVTGDDGTTSSAVNTLVLNKDGKNQITLSEDGIKVGKNSTTMDEKGIYAGSDYDYGTAKAALDATEGKIRGADGNFQVNADGKVTAKGGVDTDGGEILTRNGNINAGFGDISGKNISASGDLHADGDISGKAISGTSLNTQNGEINGGDIKSSGTIHAKGKITGNGLDAGSGAVEGNSLTLKGGDLDAGNGTITTKGNIKADGTITTKNLEVTDGFKTERITLGSKPDNYTEINTGNVTSEVNDTVSGVKYTAESIFNKDGSSITVRTNEGKVDSTGSSTVGSQIITQYLGNNAVPGGNNVTRKMIRNNDGTFSMEDKAVYDGKSSTVSQNAKEGIVSETNGGAGSKVTLTQGMNGTYKVETSSTSTEEISGQKIENYKGGLDTNITGNETHDVSGNMTTTVTGDSSLTAENITNEAKNKITNKAIDVETDATSSIVQKVTNDAGSNTSTQWSYQTKEEMSQTDGKTASYLRGAVEEKSQLIDGSKKTTIDTVAGQTNTNITDGTNTSNDLQKADQIASSVTDGTNTTVVNQDARSLASSITDGIGTKVNNSFHWVDGSAQRIEVDDTHFYAETRTAETAVETLRSGKTQINIVKDTNTATVSSAVTDGATITGISQNAKDISLSAAGGTITNDAKDVLNKGTNSVINEVGANQVAVMTDSVKAAYGLDTYTTWDDKGITSNTSGNMSNSATNITNKAEKKLSNSAVEIENKASSSIWNHVGEGYNTSWKMTDGKISESIVNGTASNKENTTAEGTKRIITSEEGTGTYNQTATSNNISLKNKAGDTSFTKSESLLKGEKTSVTNPNGSSTINQSAESIVNFVKNTEGHATKTEQSAEDITNTAKNGTITNDAKIVKTITGKNKVISDNGGTTFENEAHSTAVKDGTVKKTTISGNTIETGQATMDYADVTKDLSVGHNATVENDLTVKGTSEFVGRADFRYDVYVDNNLTVAKETRTDTLYVDHDGYVGGNLNVDGNIETHDAVLSADSRQVVTGRQLYQTNERVDRLDNRIKKVGANAAALAALRPGDFNPDDKFSIAAGFGSYRNANAAALGLFYRPNENVLLSLGTSFGDGENMVNAGVSVKFGRGKSMAERRKEMADEVSSMRDEMRSQDERIAELEEMLKKQSELIEKLSKES